jgi:hypothetical protein
MVGRKKTITARALADFMHEIGKMESVMNIRRLERESRSEKTVEPPPSKSPAGEEVTAAEPVLEATGNQPTSQSEVPECSVSYL